MNRTCRILIAICLTLLFRGPAIAQHSGPYVGAFFGGNALMAAKGSDNLGDLGLAFKPAPQGSAVLGWDFEPGNAAGEGRAELEYTRRGNPLDKVKFVEGSFKGSGTLTADSLLFNLFGVLHDGSRCSPYFGLGAGAARFEASDFKVTGQPMGSGSVVVFAYQVGGGVDLALTDHLNLDLGYRYFSSARPRFTEAGGRKFEMDYVSHSAVVGLRVGF
ncbi:MAG TPA: outer membrane beta-barrel protein [Dongiaceae bacterium]|nr:outer membrane beta-barrel protein [Dongiaceae bacterium]